MRKPYFLRKPYGDTRITEGCAIIPEIKKKTRYTPALHHREVLMDTTLRCYTILMLSTILTSLAGIISFIAIDYVWLSKIAKDFYLTNLSSHTVVKDGSLVPYLPAVPLVYIVAIIGIWVFVLSKADTLRDAFLYGALLGFVMYAFYDFTNLATLKDYPWSLTLVDIVWGTVLVGTVTAIMFYCKTALA